SARAPKFWPDSFKKFVSSYGQDKALWATDYPLLDYKRCVDEARDLELPFEIEKKLLRDNTIKAFKLEGRF
ncbi:MAG: amidohydrolase family protein, partial [Deltaproteobacteria bacterium]|nr:amidohydrolase family protein [Deltaproteobacteria bacterium]